MKLVCIAVLGLFQFFFTPAIASVTFVSPDGRTVMTDRTKTFDIVIDGFFRTYDPSILNLATPGQTGSMTIQEILVTTDGVPSLGFYNLSDFTFANVEFDTAKSNFDAPGNATDGWFVPELVGPTGPLRVGAPGALFFEAPAGAVLSDIFSDPGVSQFTGIIDLLFNAQPGLTETTQIRGTFIATPAAPVPVPAAALLFTAGIALVAGARRPRRTTLSQSAH